MKTNTPLKDDSCRTWPEIEAELRIKELEKACREMRHSLVGEGWTQEQLQTAFGDVGAAVVATEPPKGGTPTAASELDDVTKRPRLFYYEEAVPCWAPVTGAHLEAILQLTGDFEAMDDGEVYEIQLKRCDMTDREFAEIPEE